MNKEDILKLYFGYDSFRPGQAELIDAILSGRDVLGILPTGGGKSVCYQVPAMLLPGLTLVISPLISLMNDQVGALIRRGIPAALLSSELTPYERSSILDRAAKGRIKLLYISPERLRSPAFLRFLETLSSRAGSSSHENAALPTPPSPLTGCISMIAIDEAHCVSAWGHEFRPAYLEIREFIDKMELLSGRRPVAAAFTATAAPEVRAARRSAELTTQDAAAVAAALHRRDASDSQVVDFLNAAPGVTVVDSTELDFAQTVDAVLGVVRAGMEGRP